MTYKTTDIEKWIHGQVQRLTDQTLDGRPEIFIDTSDFMSIDRDHIIDLNGEFFLVRCNEHEGRCGLHDQPKFWVKRAIALDTGKTYILKLVFHEEFKTRIGTIEFRCIRSEKKESEVLQLVQGDTRFMQGRTAVDSEDNLIRVIDFIRGPDLLQYLDSIRLPHNEYFQTMFPEIFVKSLRSFRAIQFLHDNSLCHGDIRTDHIIVEHETEMFTWIDFDLTQDYADFDLWSIGNILHCIIGKGLVTFREATKAKPDLSTGLHEDDASVFFPHRVMNLRKVFPYVPMRLNEVLMRFSTGTETYYDNVKQVVDDLEEVAQVMNWPTGG